MMRRQIVGSTILLLLVSLVQTRSHISTSVPRGPGVNANALSPAIEVQLRTVAALAHARSRKDGPDPRLISALVRIEEMLPRSPATRRAQEAGKKAYTLMAASRSEKLARSWEATRAAIERQMRHDTTYTHTLAALDKRLSTCAASAPKVPRTPISTAQSLPFDQMRPGDIMIWDDRSGPPLVRFAIALYASKCTHTAIYLGESTVGGSRVQRWVLEAQSPTLGVRSNPMSPKWTRPGLHVALGHVNGVGPARGPLIASRALQTFGSDGRTPYHTWPPWDKTYLREGVYCSQLVWSIYDQNGVDLDSNDWRYLAWFTVHNWFNPYAAPTAYFGVFPDEIRASKQIFWYYDQVNR